jgi:hypothetical protein
MIYCTHHRYVVASHHAHYAAPHMLYWTHDLVLYVPHNACVVVRSKSSVKREAETTTTGYIVTCVFWIIALIVPYKYWLLHNLLLLYCMVILRAPIWDTWNLQSL